MKYIAIILLLLAIGCGWIDTTDVKRAEQFCEDKGGIKTISLVFGAEVCECVNGDGVQLNSVVLNVKNY